MQNVRVVGADFDMTIADTFSAPGDGPGVPQAYQQAVEDIFGADAWKAIGPFKNQAPIEFGRQLIETLGAEFISRRAQLYHSRHESVLDGVMPLECGVAIDWEAENELPSVVEVLVRRKLQLLLPNIGQELGEGRRWPLLMPGFDKAWEQLSKDEDIVTAVVSSGHDVFIQQVFDLHRLPHPKVIISDDHLRRRGLSIYKPDMGLWEEVLRQVRELSLQPTSSIYVGDSRQHDGGLARHALIQFLHFVAEDSPWYGHEGTFSDWSKIPWSTSKLAAE